MAKMVGLSRNLKLPWLNEVVRLYAEGLEEEQIKKQLNEYLSYEIGSPYGFAENKGNSDEYLGL